MQLVTTMKSNAVQYDWPTWWIGILRSIMSGGSVALMTYGGAAFVKLPFKSTAEMMGVNFVGMAAYRLGEFLTLHGAPEKLQTALQQASDASDNLVQQAAQVQSAVKDAKVSAAENNPAPKQ